MFIILFSSRLVGVCQSDRFPESKIHRKIQSLNRERAEHVHEMSMIFICFQLSTWIYRGFPMGFPMVFLLSSRIFLWFSCDFPIFSQTSTYFVRGFPTFFRWGNPSFPLGLRWSPVRSTSADTAENGVCQQLEKDTKTMGTYGKP